ncbi:unnamed protein product [Rhodiola kirilowii]
MGIWTTEEGRRLFTILNEYRPNRRIDWKRIETIFNSQSRDPQTVIQIKNHVHCCREKWKAWVAMNNMPGIEFMDEGLPTAAELETERIAYCCKTRDRKVSLS